MLLFIVLEVMLFGAFYTQALTPINTVENYLLVTEGHSDASVKKIINKEIIFYSLILKFFY